MLCFAVSASCVTGLTVADTGSTFNITGQVVILVLIQIGGLGIMSFTSLAFFLWRKSVSLTDRMAVGQSLLNDSNFHLGRFLILIIFFTSIIEAVGSLSLFISAPKSFLPFSAVFHSISAFCNAGFSLNSDNLMTSMSNWPVNITVMSLIIIGGLGFSVVAEVWAFFISIIKSRKVKQKFSLHSKIVVKTSLFLIISGWLLIYFAEFVNFKNYLPLSDELLTSLFQSVTARTAGFNTLDIGNITNVSLVIIMILMFIGGAPGSCAGGIKVTGFRIISAFVISQLKGRDQVIIGKYAVDKQSLNKAVTLLFFSFAIIVLSVLLMNFTEGGEMPHLQTRGRFIEILFEAVSAFGTVGLSTGLTANLTCAGKLVIIVLMFVGRLGPLMLLAALQSIQKEVLYLKPEKSIVIG